MNEFKIENVVIINDVNKILTVSTLQIAEHFGKKHKNVIQAIENLKADTSAEFSANLFFESTYPDSYGRSQKYYECTRDGFTLLAMGFTGDKALEWKIKYIEAFNRMEKTIKNGLSEREVKALEVKNEIKLLNAQARLMTAQNKRMELLLKNPEINNGDLKQVVKTYSAKEVGEMLYMSSNRVGRIANKYGLKDEKQGYILVFKQEINGAEREAIRYTEKGVAKIKEIIETERS